MCWATPSSAESSPIVLKAPGSFSPDATAALLGDPVAHDLAGEEGHHPARRDRPFYAGLGIAAYALGLVAKDEASEVGNLDVLALRQRVAHVEEDALDDACRLGARKPELAVDHVGQIGAGQGSCNAALTGDPGDSKIGHLFL